ncbi:DUF4249 family protein [Pontibacter rugosus]
MRWSFASQYAIFTQPWAYINPTTGLPAPKDCCMLCYSAEKFEQLKVTDDRLTNGRKVINQNVLFIPFNRYLGVKNKLKIYQYSITSEAYDFFRILEQQKESTGTVFDPPPAEVKGNVFNVSDNEEKVIGFFDVAGVSTKEVVILKEDIEYRMRPFIFPDDCRVIRGVTTNPPPGW